jgi:putative acetyltransferase
MTAPHHGARASIRPVSGADEHPRLVEIWRTAVDATHHFLTTEDRDDIESHLASDHLPHVELHVAELDGVPVGFAGVADESLEMLFVDADQRGAGVGSDLLAFVVAEREVTTVDVNEQNGSAVAFYLRRGFAVVGRSDVDDQGRPYPILHLSLGGRGRRGAGGLQRLTEVTSGVHADARLVP